MAITAGQSFTGKVGVPFSQAPDYTGTPTEWSATGLPSGLSINSSTGLITGTPTAIGNTTATLTVKLNSNSQLSGVTAIAAARFHSLALKNDGTVAACGSNNYGQTSIPAGLSGVTAIAAGEGHSLALKNNGTVVAWGFNSSGQTSIPAGLSGATAIAAGGFHSLALKNDGTVVAWGSNNYGQTSIPAGLSGVTAISAGYNYSLALKNDGTVVAWGANDYGETSIPAGLSGVIAIAAGRLHSLALKNDGTVVAWGLNSSGQTSVPAGLSGVTAIAAENSYSLALKNDGTVVAWGFNNYIQASIPAGLSGVTAIAAGYNHSLALKNDGTVVAWGANDYGQTDFLQSAANSETVNFTIAAGAPLITDSQSFTGTVGAAFSQTPALTNAANRPVSSWAATSLPAGLSINTTTGAITGTPQDTGSTAIMLTASGPGGTDTETASISIAAGPPIITPGQSFTGTVGTAFSQPLSLTDAVDRPATSWAATGLPSGLSINANTGAITGTPTTAGTPTASITATGPGGTSAPTSISFTISASGGGGGGGNTMSILLAENQSLISTLGVPFSGTPALLIGTAASWYASGLPEWASINSTTGAITGTPTFSGNSVVTVTAKASDNATSTVLLFLKTTSWNTLEIFVDPKARRVLSKADNKSPLSKITLKRDDRLPFRVIFVDGTTPFSIPDSFSVSLGLKQSYAATDYLAYSSSATGTLDLSSEEIQALFLSNAATIPTMLEVRWESPTSSFRTVTLPADLQNSVIRGNEYSPAAYFGADATATAAATSSAVRSLSTPVFGVAKGNSYNITILPTDRRVSIAYPASLGDLASVRYSEFNNSDITDTFTKTTVQVSAPGASTIPYFVYTYIAGVPFDDYANYTVTL